jgi:hypothetical protein
MLPGAYGRDESTQEYEQLLLRLRAGGGYLHAKPTNDLTIAELVLRFMQHAASYYVDPVTKQSTTEVGTCRDAFRPLVRLHGNDVASSFGPLALQSLRAAMVSGAWMSDSEREMRVKRNRPIGLARSTCNKHISRIKMLFKGAASAELIPASVAHAVAMVPGLRRGRTEARETKPVVPVSSELIEKTLHHLHPVVRDMVQILFRNSA